MTRAEKDEKRRQAIIRAKPVQLSLILHTLLEQWYYGIRGKETPEGFSYPKIEFGDKWDTLVVLSHIAKLEQLNREVLISYGKKPGFVLTSQEERQCNWKISFLNDKMKEIAPDLSYTEKLIVETDTVFFGFWDYLCVNKELRPEFRAVSKAFEAFADYLIPDEEHYLAQAAHEHYMTCSKALDYDFS